MEYLGSLFQGGNQPSIDDLVAPQQKPDYSSFMSGLVKQGTQHAQDAFQPMPMQGMMRRDDSPFPQQPGVFEMQDKPALPPDIQALVEALRGANGR